MWWSELGRNHRTHGSLLQARQFFITLLGRDRLGSRSPGYLLRRLIPPEDARPALPRKPWPRSRQGRLEWMRGDEQEHTRRPSFSPFSPGSSVGVSRG
jgi:hypothetical protein